jgi:ribosome-associated heat shock protein Hsp15
MAEKVRLDKWLWAARFFKTRALARDAIKGGKVQLNGVRVKPGRVVALSDELVVRRGEDEYRVTVKDTDERRLSAALAAEKFEEDPAARVAREAAAEQRKLEYQERKDRPRRPDKRQRREIVRFTKTGR